MEDPVNQTGLVPSRVVRFIAWFRRVVLLASAMGQLGAACVAPRAGMPRRLAQASGDDELIRDEGTREVARIPAGVRAFPDLAYGPDPLQKVDVYAPPLAQDAPMIAMVHGGAWMIGDKTSKTVVENKVARWVPRGFVFVSVNYRMVPKVGVGEEAQDVARALAWVQQHAGAWGGDGHRVVLMGHSAGAHLVTLLSADSALARAQGVQPWLGTVALDSAAYDVSAIMRRPHSAFYDRVFGKDPAIWAANSPTPLLTSFLPPFLAVCSTRRKNSCPPAQDFVAKARALGIHAEVLTEDKTHRQINEDLGAGPAYTAQVEAFMSTLDPGLARLLAR